jgi:hypothetical protein
MPRQRKNGQSRPAQSPSLPPVHTVNVREFRAHFKELLESCAPIIVGHSWRPRALVLPCQLPEGGPWLSPEERRARLRALFAAALERV